MASGEPMPFKPSLDIESLRSFMPAVPSGANGNSAIVMENLGVLGTSDPVGAPQNMQASIYAADLDRAGVRFFADVTDIPFTQQYIEQQKVRQEAAAEKKALKAASKAASKAVEAAAAEGEEKEEREAADKSAVPEVPAEGQSAAVPMIGGAEDSVRQVILQRAIEGRHEKPIYAEDVAGIARARHLRTGTYTQRDVNIFEAKLNSLLAGGKSAKGNQGKAKRAAPKA